MAIRSESVPLAVSCGGKFRVGGGNFGVRCACIGWVSLRGQEARASGKGGGGGQCGDQAALLSVALKAQGRGPNLLL